MNCIFVIPHSSFSHTVSHWFSKHIRNTYYVPNTVPVLTGIIVNKRREILQIHTLTHLQSIEKINLNKITSHRFESSVGFWQVDIKERETWAERIAWTNIQRMETKDPICTFCPFFVCQNPTLQSVIQMLNWLLIFSSISLIVPFL